MPLRPSSTVEIVPYDPFWEEEFQALKTHLLKILKGPLLSIEHIGSTAVPGLVAKPILDIDIVMDSLHLLQEVIEDLERYGYHYEGDKGVLDREAFKRRDIYTPYGGRRESWMDHHLYVCPKKSRELRRHLLFRDYLREHPERAQEYGELKEDLAKQYRHHREKYTQGKSVFIEEILKDCLPKREIKG